MNFLAATLLLLTISATETVGIRNFQSARNDIETTVAETAYYVVPSYGGKYKVMIAVVAINPFEDKFASRPGVRVTARAADGSVITTREVSSAGIPPKSRIAFCESLYADEAPVKVEFRSLSANYEPTVYRPTDFLPLELMNVRVRDDAIGRLRITGEIKNPYSGETGAWITFLYRDVAGKLLGGHMKWESTISVGDPTPFEMYVNSDEVPAETKSVNRLVFNHNNFQTSWNKLLRR